jgi:hypothetical protein
MAKIQYDEVCPCGSGITFGQCHDKKIRQRSPQISQHIRLTIIAEPDPNTRTVFQKTAGTGTIFFQGSDGTDSLDCGSCDAQLAVGVSRNMFTRVVMQCSACGTFNDT